MFLLLVLSLLGCLRLRVALEIPTATDVKSLTFDDYAVLTNSLTRPIILKSFFDATAFQSVCSCQPDATLFDTIDVPYKPGNSHHEVYKAMTDLTPFHSGAMNGGDFYRSHACMNKDDYIFFDTVHGVGMLPKVRRFFDTALAPLLRVHALTDKAYDSWYHEIFLGFSSREYPLPSENSSGSAPHRAPVLNHYFQICGKKLWHVADHAHSLGGNLDGHRFLVNSTDMLDFIADERVYHGYTEPGDVLLNPPWLWHMVRTAVGMNFAVTYKQMKYAWWASLMKMDRLQADFHFKELARKRGQVFPHRELHPVGTQTLDVWISTPGEMLEYLLHYGAPADFWLVVAPEDLEHVALVVGAFSLGIAAGCFCCGAWRLGRHACLGLVVLLAAACLKRM